jgi:energy-coupling factor transporter ATP-binding protein EcfA2
VSQNQNDFEDRSSLQKQSLGDVQIQGDDNTFNVIQAQNITLTQTKIIQISIDEIKTHELNTTSPYKGLKKFEPEDADRFFGRDQFLDNLVNELEQTNLVLLLGASGSGKSSVVRAGLIPWLSRKWGNKFVNLMLTPDRDPFESLYGSLLGRGFSQSQAELARAGKGETLSQVVKTLKTPESFWLIFIDQFEELFTISEAEKRDRFILSLVQLSKEQASNPLLKIVATMRSDFLDRLDPAPANRLARITEKHRPLITQMHQDELRLAIEQPAAHHGVVFESGLVKQIIDDIQGQAGYLPLLQYTLNLLWETEVQSQSIADRTLNISNYRQLGGVRGALQQHVDQIYNALSEAEKLTAQRIMLKLVDIGGDEESGTEWKPVRRRAYWSEFAENQEQKILMQLINQNLLISNRQPQAQESTVEIAHEALLTSWTRLHDWIRNNRQAIALRNRLNEDVARWRSKKIEDELWRGSKLEQVLELRKNVTFNQILGGFSPEANQFIEDSLGRRDRLNKAEKKRRQSERIKTGTAIAFLVATIVATFLAGINLLSRQKAEIVQRIQNGKVTPADLDTLLHEADQLKLKADRKYGYKPEVKGYKPYDKGWDKDQDLATALFNYRWALQGVNSHSIHDSRVEMSLEKILYEYRIPKLKTDLEKAKISNKFGELILNAKLTDFESQYTESPLRTTYQILMQSFGAGADLNQDGKILNKLEAAQIPCLTLKEIEKLWRDYTKKRCGWYGSDTVNGEYENNQCTELNHESLINIIFDPIDFARDRIDQCLPSLNPTTKYKSQEIK